MGNTPFSHDPLGLVPAVINAPAVGSTLDALHYSYTYDPSASVVAQTAAVIGATSDALGKTTVATANIFTGFGIVGITNDFAGGALAFNDREYGDGISRASSGVLGAGMLLGSRMANDGIFGDSAGDLVDIANPLVVTAQTGVFFGEETQALIDYGEAINEAEHTIDGLLNRSDQLMAQLAQVHSQMKKDGCK